MEDDEEPVEVGAEAFSAELGTSTSIQQNYVIALLLTLESSEATQAPSRQSNSRKRSLTNPIGEGNLTPTSSEDDEHVHGKYFNVIWVRSGAKLLSRSCAWARSAAKEEAQNRYTRRRSGAGRSGCTHDTRHK